MSKKGQNPPVGCLISLLIILGGFFCGKFGISFWWIIIPAPILGAVAVVLCAGTDEISTHGKETGGFAGAVWQGIFIGPIVAMVCYLIGRVFF